MIRVSNCLFKSIYERPKYESYVLFTTLDNPEYVRAGIYVLPNTFISLEPGYPPHITEKKPIDIKEWWYANDSRPIPNEDIKRPEDSAKRSLILADISRLVNELKDLK